MAIASFAILVVTLDRRRPYFDRLMRVLDPQITPRVAVHTLAGNERIGTKRQRLIEYAREPFVAFVDDDDVVSGDYCASVLSGIDAGADVVGFRLRQFNDGRPYADAVHSLTSRTWASVRRGGRLVNLRTPNHLNPIRRELALSIGYKPLNSGEDADYSHRLYRRHGATMREHFIDRVLYGYLYRSPRLRIESPSQIVRDFHL